MMTTPAHARPVASPARDLASLERDQAREARDHPARGAVTMNPQAPGARVTMVMMAHGAMMEPLARVESQALANQARAALMKDGLEMDTFRIRSPFIPQVHSLLH
jgi:hypothetical protein